MSIPVAEKDPEDIEEDSDFIEDNDASGERERGGGGGGGGGGGAGRTKCIS